MAIQKRKIGKVCVFEVSGSMNIGRGDVELREAFKEAIRDGERSFLFNLTKVSYMDSAAIGETVACAKRAAEAGGTIKIVLVPKGRPDEILRVTSLDRVFEIFTDEKEALVSFI